MNDPNTTHADVEPMLEEVRRHLRPWEFWDGAEPALRTMCREALDDEKPPSIVLLSWRIEKAPAIAARWLSCQPWADIKQDELATVERELWDEWNQMQDAPWTPQGSPWEHTVGLAIRSFNTTSGRQGVLSYLVALVGEKESPHLARVREAIQADQGPLIWLHQDFDDFGKVCRALAGVVWDIRLGALLGNRRRKPPALVLGVLTELMTAHSGRKPLDLTEPVPALDNQVLQTMARIRDNNGSAMQTLDAHRVFYWEVSTAMQQNLDGNTDWRRIVTEGGWEAVAELAGATSKKSAETVNQVIVMQAHWPFPLPNGASCSLLSYTYQPASPRNRASVSIVVGDALTFGFANLMPQRHRYLVPILPPPPGIGDRCTYGAQATFQTLILAEMRARAIELITNSGILFSKEDLVRLAKAAALPIHMIPRVVDHWKNDADRLLEPEQGRLTLTDTWWRERNFLIDGAKRQTEGSKAGKKGAKGRK